MGIFAICAIQKSAKSIPALNEEGLLQIQFDDRTVDYDFN
jgi:hypothetical protein